MARPDERSDEDVGDEGQREECARPEYAQPGEELAEPAPAGPWEGEPPAAQEQFQGPPPAERRPPAADEDRPRPGSLNFHRDVEPWVDTCSCEPEPRWRALEE